MIGTSLRRLEDTRLITGRGRYVDDIEIHGMMHAVFVRSQEAHAIVDSIRFDPPDGNRARLLTADVLDLGRPMPVQNPSPIIEQPFAQSPLADVEVCYVGQPIAVVLAPTAAEAVDGLDWVHVEYDPLPATVDHRRALDPDAPAVHRDSTSNRVATIDTGYGDANSVLAATGRVLRLEFDQHRGAVGSLEGRAVLARWDTADDRLALWTSSQSPYAVREMLAGYLGLPNDDIRVTTPDVGGGFGPKAVVHPEEIVVAALAVHLRSAVKWVERRREHFVATIQQRGQSGTAEVAFDDEGRLLAIRARLIHDLGAFVPYGVVVPFTTMRLMSGPYVVPNVDVAVDCVFTNATPTAAIRGAGRPNAAFILERAIDAIAGELGLDRGEVRSRNFIPVDRFPYQLEIRASDGNPLTYDGGDYEQGLRAAMAAADLDGFEERKAASAEDGRLRGYGIASYVEDTGLGPYDGARIEILASGEVILETGVSSQGQGHGTVFAQICAQHLGIEPGAVTVRNGDTDRYGHGVSTVASRTGQTAAPAVNAAAADLADMVKRLAAARLEAAPEDIVLTEGVAMVVGQPGSEISLADLAGSAQPKAGGSLPEGSHSTGLSAEQVHVYGGSAFTYGTHIAEVEIDPETGHVAVRRYVVVHDCGTLLNPMIVDGQIDGGVAHGLGNALTERVIYDEAGQPLTTSFMDYRLMAAEEVPELIKVHMETASPTNPLGAKGAGEGGTIPTAAAVVSAVEHAVGISPGSITHYPVSPAFVREALGEAALAMR